MTKYGLAVSGRAGHRTHVARAYLYVGRLDGHLRELVYMSLGGRKGEVSGRPVVDMNDRGGGVSGRALHPVVDMTYRGGEVSGRAGRYRDKCERECGYE
jgi:hypothetical protein